MSDMYFDMIEAAKAYYGAGDPSYITLISHNYTPQEYANILKQIPGVDVTLDSNGVVRSWNYQSAFEFTDTATDIAQQVNSNIQSGTASAANTAQLNYPITSSLDSNGKVELGQGGTQYSGGTMAGAALTIIGGVQASVAAAATGFALGKTISSELYDAFPNFFDSHNMEYFNPSKWGEMADFWERETGSELVGDAIRLLYGVDSNDNLTAYLRSDQLEYFAAYLASMGVFDSGGLQYESVSTIGTYNTTSYCDLYDVIKDVAAVDTGVYNYVVSHETDIRNRIGNRKQGAVVRTIITSGGREYIGYIAIAILTPVSSVSISTVSNGVGVTNTTCEYYFEITRVDFNTNIRITTTHNYPGSKLLVGRGTYTSGGYPYPVWTNINTTIGSGAPTGIGNQTGATLPQINSTTPYSDILPQILTDIPYLNDNRIEIPYVDENGNEKTYVYYPVPFPTGGENNRPTGETVSQTTPVIDPEFDPSTATVISSATLPDPSPMTDTEPDNLNPDSNPPDTGSGSSPTIVTPTGNASRLWSVYNPSQAEVDAFGAWLWSANFIDQVKKLFADPMQAVIGIHKIFVTPIVSGTGTIVCGYLDSQVSSNLVGNQYVNVSCGSVNLFEYFGNVFDYYDTEISIYLPFIGIHQLDASYVMRSTISVIYHVDVYTGATLAELKILRDGYEAVIYTFSGDCSVRYPLSSGSYMGIVSGILSAGSALLTGGAGGIVGGLLTLGNSKTSVEKSGSLQGNTGAMGCKKPYLIISRPQTAITNFEHYQGYGSNQRVAISSLSGYAKLTDVDVQGVSGATGEELQMIKNILESGIHITG